MDQIFVFDEPIYFTNSNRDYKDFKNIIRFQANSCCRYAFNRSYILESLDEFTDGFLILGDQLYQTNRGIKGKYILKGFILFIKRKNKIMGKILCGHTQFRGMGLILLNEVKKFAIENSISSWEISALNKDKLLKHYENFGFVRYNEQRDHNGNIRLVDMYYNFNHNINNYINELEEDNTFDVECESIIEVEYDQSSSIYESKK